MRCITPDWFADVSVQAFIAFCAEHSLPIRFVGGCVRDSVIGREVGDIDVATSATPHQVLEAAARSPFKAIPTGLAHGTVTLVVHGRAFEVTTLRMDTACDGRHARVQFTDDWEVDAMRRDFTFNALMLSPDGTLYDYTGGIQDVCEGRVRFIGEASERIAEDYLRILRFFRFYATYGKIPLDGATISALADNAPYLTRLSVERIAQEMRKLLAASSPVAALILMREAGVLNVLCPDATPDIAALSQLIALEHAPDMLLRLHVLYPLDAIRFATHWRFSNAQQRALNTLASASPITNAHELRLALYRHSRAIVIATLERDAALSHENMNQEWAALAQHALIPVFPMNGSMLLELGAPPGHALGHTLKRLEAAWISSDFILTQEQLLMQLNHAI